MARGLRRPLLLPRQYTLRLDKVATSSYFGVVRAVGVKVLKNKLSEYVRLAQGGETVLVTDRDRVVAELGPPRPGRSPLLSDALLAEALREGWMTAPLVVAEGPPPRLPVGTWEDLARELDADRGDR
jgi:antitoxin (DNA-binding transcriptional repressor) of toxin-antitoxin stability system